MSYQSPTIADIIHWISKVPNSSPALAYLAQELSKNPNPEYSFRTHIFHNLKKNHGTKEKPIFTEKSYSSLPFPVAYTLKEVNEHSYSDLVQLLFLFDAVEIWVRWLVNVYVGVIVSENEQNLPTQLAAQINEQMKRPSFGSWVSILELLHKNVRVPLLQRAKIPFKEIRPLITIRNAIAHGNISGDLSGDRDESIKRVKIIIKSLASLSSIPTIAAHQKQEYSFVGVELAEQKSSSLEDGLYCMINGSYIKLTPLFRLKQREGTPLVLSYFSSKGSLKKASDGSILEFVEINGGDVEHNEDQDLLKQFISLFQTNQKVSSSHPWQEKLKSTKSLPSQAWDFEKLLIKSWMRARTDDVEEKKPHILWFGGDVQTGKTTVLTSSLHRLHQKSNLLFLYSFPETKELGINLSQEEATSLHMDRLFRQFRDAIVYWSQKHIKTEIINHQLSGDDLYKDCKERLHLLLDLENTTPYEIMVGLDDVHNLVLDDTAPCTVLLSYLEDLYIQKNGRYKRGRDEFVEQTKVRVLFVVTGRSTNSQSDLDDVFVPSSTVDRLFSSEVYQTFTPENKKPFVNEKGEKVIPEARYVEIESYQRLYHDKADQGAHLVPIEKSGAISILTAPKKNEGLLSVFQASEEHSFLQNVLKNAHGKPLYIHSIAEKLEGEEISIDSDLSQISPLSAYFSSRMEEEFISDDRRILAFIICILHYYYDRGVALSISSLQMLHDQDLEPHPEKEEAMIRAIYSAPGLLKSVPLSRKNTDGTLLYGWKLASQEIEQNITNNKELIHTRLEVQERILWFYKNHKKIMEGTEAKELFTPNKETVSSFVHTFRSLRDTLQDGILSHEPAEHLRPLYNKIQNGLLRLCSSWNTQKAWLQQCYEFDKNHQAHKDAVQFLEENPKWNEIWLKRVNAPHLPIFDHEKGGFSLHERADTIVPLEAGYFLVEHSTGTSTKPIFSSVSLCHKAHNQPLHIFSHEDPVSCCLTYIDDRPVLVYATKAALYFYPLYLDEYQPPTNTPSSYSYDGICQILTLPNHNIAIAGTKPDTKGKWVLEEIDVQNKSVVRSWICAPSKSSSPQNLFCFADAWCFHVGAQLVRCPLDGSEAQAEKIPEGAPKEVFAIYNHEQEEVGIASWKGAKAKNYSARLDSVPSIALQPPKKPTPKPVAVFEYQNDLLIVSFNGTISLFEKGVSLNLVEVLKSRSAIIDSDSVELRGAILVYNELVVYGKESILCSLELQGDDISSWKLNEWPQLHYGKGGISNIQLIKQDIGGFEAPLLLSQSDDNDIRLWDVSSRTCVGLFRAHANKLKLFSVFDNTLISIDVEKNLRVWEIQQSARKQYKSASQKQSPFINRVVGTDDGIFVLNQNFETSLWPSQGEIWTQQSSQEAQRQQENSVFGSLKRSIPLSKSVMCHVSSTSSNRLHIFQTQRNEHISMKTVEHPQSQKETEWEIAKISRAGTDQILVSGTAKYTDKNSKEECFFVALICEEGAIRQYRELENLASSMSYIDDKSILVCQEEGTQKTVRQIYWDEASKKDGIEYSFTHSASIAGIYISSSQKKILMWDAVSGRSTSFFCVHEEVLYGPFSNPNCTHSPSKIIETKQGLVFTEKDVHRWNLSMEVREDELQPVLHAASSEMYVLAHFSELYAQLTHSHPYLCSSKYPIFAEEEAYGVNVYYSSQSGIHHATWMGTMMRNYTVGAIFDEGRIVAYKNREVIVLQVMRGNKEISFAELLRQ